MTELSETVRASREFPLLSQIVGRFYDGWDEHGIDPEEVLIHQIADWGKPSAQDELRILMDRSPTEADLAREFQALGVNCTTPPEGNNWRRWAEHVARRLRERGPAPPTDFHFRDLPRASRFTDEATANAASTLVLRGHEQRVRSWAERNDGWWRLHLYADLAADLGQTGWMMHRGQETPEPVTGAVVLMQLHHEDRSPYIATAYPEVYLDTTVRDRWPDLCNLLGGYFGQDHGDPWPAQDNVLSSTQPPARDRWITQLEELLAEPDDERLAEHVDSLGGYLHLLDLRGWLERMRWRIDAFDWTPADDG